MTRSGALLASFDALPAIGGRTACRDAALDAAPRGGLHLEFGVYRGDSLRALATRRPEETFYGFDSMLGLPEPWDTGRMMPNGQPRGIHEVGTFRVDGPPSLPANAAMVVGWIQDTLPRFMRATWETVSFVHVDVDLRSSARHVLGGVSPRLAVGAVVLFDELGNWGDRYPKWREGEWAAVEEWLDGGAPWSLSAALDVRALCRSDLEQAALVVVPRDEGGV